MHLVEDESAEVGRALLIVPAALVHKLHQGKQGVIEKAHHVLGEQCHEGVPQLHAELVQADGKFRPTLCHIQYCVPQLFLRFDVRQDSDTVTVGLLDDVDCGAALLHDVEELAEAKLAGDTLQVESLVEVPVVEEEVLVGVTHV